MTQASIPEELLAAYYAAEYRIATPGETITIKPDTRSEALQQLLQSMDCSSCAFITACNPRSELKTEAENNARQARLEAAIRGRWNYLPGESIDPGGQWPAEPSFLILGIDVVEAARLAQGQNAFLFADAQGQVSLVPV